MIFFSKSLRFKRLVTLYLGIFENRRAANWAEFTNFQFYKLMKTTKQNAAQNAQNAAQNAAQEVLNALAKDERNAQNAHTQEELAEKQRKQDVKRMDTAVTLALDATCEEVLGVSRWLKVFKKHMSKEYAVIIDDNWATICRYVEMNATEQYYLEEVTTKDGKKATKVHMCKFVPTNKLKGRTILATRGICGYMYDAEEGEQSATCVNDLTLTRDVKVIKTDNQTINGETWYKRIESVVTMELKPYEVHELSKGEFKRGIKAAMAIVFPNGFAVSK